MRNHAQGAMRSRRGLTRQGVVHVYGLHESKSRHDQHEDQRRPFLEQPGFELAIDLHNGSSDSNLRQLDVKIRAQEARILQFSPT